MDTQHPPVERELAFDLVKRGLPIAPLIILAAGLIEGWSGAASAAVAIGIVFLNFLAAAATLTRRVDTGKTNRDAHCNRTKCRGTHRHRALLCEPAAPEPLISR